MDLIQWTATVDVKTRMFTPETRSEYTMLKSSELISTVTLLTSCVFGCDLWGDFTIALSSRRISKQLL